MRDLESVPGYVQRVWWQCGVSSAEGRAPLEDGWADQTRRARPLQNWMQIRLCNARHLKQFVVYPREIAALVNWSSEFRSHELRPGVLELAARYLKVRVLSHHRLEDNYYCALTRFQATRGWRE